MSKNVIIGCVAIVVVSFIGSCFLMSTVNPPPIKKTLRALEEPSVESRRVESNELSSDPLESLTPFYRFNPASMSASMNNATPIEEDDDPLFNFPPNLIKKVVPPLYPLSFIPTTKTTTQEVITTELNSDEKYESLNTTDAEIVSSVSSPAPEKVLRRSANDFFDKVIAVNSSSVVLKILDQYGQPRIEIKINTDYSSKTKEDSLKLAPGLEMIVQQNSTRKERVELGSNAEIRFLPNDTVIIESNTENLFESDNVVTTDNIKKESNTNNSAAVTLPNTKNSSTYVNIDDKQINTDKLNKSDVINYSFYPYLQNSLNSRIDFTNKINNGTEESIMQFSSNKNDAKDIKNAKLRIVKDAENKSTIFRQQVGEKHISNISIEIKKLGNSSSALKKISLVTVKKGRNKTEALQHVAITNKQLNFSSSAATNTKDKVKVYNSTVLNKDSTTIYPRSSSPASTKTTHSYELKVLFHNETI